MCLLRECMLPTNAKYDSTGAAVLFQGLPRASPSNQQAAERRPGAVDAIKLETMRAESKLDHRWDYRWSVP